MSGIMLTYVAIMHGILGPAAVVPESRPEMQAVIVRLVEAETPAARRERLTELLTLAEQDRGKIVAQLVFYAGVNAAQEESRAKVGRVLRLLELQREQIVFAVAPLLDSGKPEIAGAAAELLIDQEDRSPSRPPDFTAYRAVIEAQLRNGGASQESLVRHMYRSDPGAALLAMVHASSLRRPEEIKPILWAEHVVADLFWKRRFGFLPRDGVEPSAIEQVRSTSQHPIWWVRLFAAHIIASHPELGDAQTVARLASDPHALVREAIRPAGKK